MGIGKCKPNGKLKPVLLLICICMIRFVILIGFIEKNTSFNDDTHGK
jgi:hypothetical protein